MNSEQFICIPFSILKRGGLPDGAKLLFGSLAGLARSKGFCEATNPYLAERHGVKKDTVSRWIADLQRAGLIQVDTGQKDGFLRRIFITVSLSDEMPIGLDKMPIGTDKKPIAIGQKTDSYTDFVLPLSDEMPIAIGQNAAHSIEESREESKTENTAANAASREEHPFGGQAAEGFKNSEMPFEAEPEKPPTPVAPPPSPDEAPAPVKPKAERGPAKAEKALNVSFADFWDTYNHKTGSKKDAERLWRNLSDAERLLAFAKAPEFDRHYQGEKQYQPYPTTYLNQRRWETALIPRRPLAPAAAPPIKIQYVDYATANIR